MLEAYALAADAFTTTAEERALEPESWWVKRIADPKDLAHRLAPSDGERLVGTAAIEYSAKSKSEHAALIIGSMWVESAKGQAHWQSDFSRRDDQVFATPRNRGRHADPSPKATHLPFRL